jgi:hypothetical protein
MRVDRVAEPGASRTPYGPWRDTRSAAELNPLYDLLTESAKRRHS